MFLEFLAFNSLFSSDKKRTGSKLIPYPSLDLHPDYMKKNVFKNPETPEDSEVNVYNYRGDFKELPLNPHEVRKTIDTSLDEETILNWQENLQRKLTFKELNILGILSNHGIKLNEKDFKRLF